MSNPSTFGQMIRPLLQGKRVTRADWKDPRIHLIMFNSILMINVVEDGKDVLHPLTISDGDLSATDWVILR